MTRETTAKGPLGQRLVCLMRAAGIRSKKELCAQTGISPMSLHRYERGSREPVASTLIAIATALQCSTDELLGLRPIGSIEVSAQEHARAVKRLKELERRLRVIEAVAHGQEPRS